MAFTLARNSGANVPTEVQRWQYFLRRMRIPQVGGIDGDFGQKTEEGTKIFQLQAGLSANGKVNEATLGKAAELGYTILPDDYYETRADAGFPPEPADLDSPGNTFRNQTFTCFRFKQLQLSARGDPDGVVITRSCDGEFADWTSAKIVDIEIPQLAFAVGYPGRLTCHRRAADAIRAVFAAWEAADLLHLIRTFDGCFNPRYKRGKSPSDGAHGLKDSVDVTLLSNHAFGSALDINADDNPFGGPVAKIGRRGCVREMVEIANAHNLYWGGHYQSTKDGMHFELSRL